jgi:Dolichyl-phosphate-mannose-protein mannosyltransferase
VVTTKVPRWCFVGAVALGALLRLWSLGHGHLSADESYSAVNAHLPFTQIWGHIAATDPHPPFSYLLLSPVAHLFTSNLAVRLPAALCSILAVAVMAWWQRDRGVAGLVATLVLAVSPFALEYGREARMYGLVTLASVLLAAAADRWLVTGDRQWATVAGVAAFVITMSYSAGAIMPVALALVAGWRRDREAWELRLAAAAAFGAWAALWLAHTIHWSHASSGYPSLSVVWIRQMLTAMIAPVPSEEWLVLGMLLLGLIAVCWRSARERVLVLALFVAPVLALAVVSLHNNIFLPKSLIMVAWAPSLLLGGLVGVAWDYRPLLGGIAIAGIAVVTLPYVSTALSIDEGAGAMVAAVAAARQPGDAMAMSPVQLGTLLDWYEAIGPGHGVRSDTRLIPGAVVYRFAGETQTGRIWLVESEARSDIDWHGPGLSGSGWQSCGASRPVGGGYTMRCVEPATTR